MPGVLYDYLANDHDRLEGLLGQATSRPGKIELESYAEFRKGLLRHISIEEKIVIPAIAKSRGGKTPELAARLRLDHGALAALLVPPPSALIVTMLRKILSPHNILEEQGEGLYEQFETAVGSDSATMVERLRMAPEVPVMPHNERPEVLEAIRRAVERAGYTFGEPLE